MIQANIIAVDSSFDIATGGMQHYLVLQLPNGAFVRSEVDQQTTEVVLQYVADGGDVISPVAETPDAEPPTSFDISTPPTDVAEEAPPPPTFTNFPMTGFTRVAPGEQPVVWERLPDDVLQPHLKAALRGLGVADEMSAANLAELVKRIQAEFTPDQWAVLGVSPGAIMGSEQPAHEGGTTVPVQPAAPPQAPQQSPLGQIQWADGGPILPGMGRVARTVPKDDMGYPIVSTTDVDPGEIVVGGDADEDGVGQV